MSELDRIGLEAFGVPLAISAPSAVLPRVETVLPPGWSRREPAEEDHEFSLRPRTGSTYAVVDEVGALSGSSDLEIALQILDSRLRACIALHAPDYIFVHAGAVAHGGRAIVIPGRSFGGKTTLVAELVRAGATYYSDEFAVLDGQGLVHPYPKRLSIRQYGQDYDVGALGGGAGDSPLRIGLIAAGLYVPGVRWEPRRLSGGEAVLEMLSNTVPAQERPEQALSAIRHAVEGAVVLKGERGEAAEVVDDLLQRAAPQPESLRD